MFSLTGSKCDADFLRLDLSDLLGLQLLARFANGHVFVGDDRLTAVGVFDHRLAAAPFHQRLQLITSAAYGLPLLQEILRAAAYQQSRRPSTKNRILFL